MQALSAEPPPLRPGDRAVLRRIIREGSRSFHAASRLLPARVCEAAFALYAFCRMSDDLVDETAAGRGTIDLLHARLEGAYAGTPANSPIDRAFARAVYNHRIPKALPAALIEGMEWDVEERRYDTLADVEAYSARVAGAVGAMMTLVMGATSRQALARATDLGLAMQLTNIARDIGEDARRGRLYLPLDWFDEAGLDPEAFLADPKPSPALAGLTRRLLGEAQRHYARGLAGIALLPRSCRSAITAAGLIYAEIGRVVAANGYDSVSRRAVVPSQRKLALVAKSLSPQRPRPDLLDLPPLPANRFLVDAALAAQPDTPALTDLGLAARMLELCLRADERQRGLIAGSVR